MGVFNAIRGWPQWFAGALACLTSLAHAGDAEFARVIVKLKPDASVLRTSLVQAQSASNQGQAGNPMGRLGLRRGLTVEDGRDIGNHMHVAMARGISSEALAASLAKDSDVMYAVPDRLRKPMVISGTPTDPLFADSSVSPNPNVEVGQWYLRPHDATFKSAINATSAWASVTGTGVTVAVLDSGIRFDHADLASKPNLYAGYNMISYASVSQVNGGRSADASDLGDWVTSSDITSVNAELGGNTGCKVQASSSWHGTGVAAIIGAQTNNGIGMASVAPDAALVPIRVLGKCGGWDSDILAGMRWAAGQTVSNVPSTNPHPAKVLNLSLGADGSCPQTYKDVLAELAASQVVVVASAGNENGLAVSSPANCPGVIAVAGLRHVGTKVAFSSVGPEVSISAPGGNCVNEGTNQPCLYPILTASNAGFTQPVSHASGGSIYTDSTIRPTYGTSFSAPQVSGAVALMLEARPALTPAAVRSLLMASARSFPTSGSSSGVAACQLPTAAVQDECYCTQLTCGGGMLDVDQAVQFALTKAVAVVSKTPDSPQPGQTITFSGAQSMVSPGATSIVSYHWALLNGGGIVSSSGWSANSVNLVVPTSRAGAFQIRLTVEDDLGQVASSDQWIVVGLPSSSGSSNVSTSGGGGGGGSVGVAELMAMSLVLLSMCLPGTRRIIKA